jgi:GalNAc-alpha-(1->4)-GalNAc-alpha-(1->3)-diNAcBac-PP-undecaprenol alpha-1,4-N-acetyl-D-galactosaminyltransferase
MNQQRKHFCFILPSLVGGGMERVMVELANNFVEKRNAKVSFVLLRNAPKFYILDSRIEIYEPQFRFNKKNLVFLSIRTLLFTRKTVRKINPDIVLSFGEKWNSINLISLLNTKYKVVISDRSSPNLKLSFIHKILRLILYKKAYGIIAQTVDANLNLTKLIKHKNIITIGNPIREIYKNDVERENIILNVGRFISTKQQWQLVEIFATINNDNWKLVFIGDGAHFEEAKKRVNELGINYKVDFIGESKNVDEYYVKSKIFAFTSVLEGFPNALGEALNASLACISYDCLAGPKDLINHDENGYLIKINNKVEYAYRLELLMEDENLRKRFISNSNIKMKEFSIEDISTKFYNFLIS